MVGSGTLNCEGTDVIRSQAARAGFQMRSPAVTVMWPLAGGRTRGDPRWAGPRRRPTGRPFRLPLEGSLHSFPPLPLIGCLKRRKGIIICMKKEPKGDADMALKEEIERIVHSAHSGPLRRSSAPTSSRSGGKECVAVRAFLPDAAEVAVVDAESRPALPHEEDPQGRLFRGNRAEQRRGLPVPAEED